MLFSYRCNVGICQPLHHIPLPMVIFIRPRITKNRIFYLRKDFCRLLVSLEDIGSGGFPVLNIQGWYIKLNRNFLTLFSLEAAVRDNRFPIPACSNALYSSLPSIDLKFANNAFTLNFASCLDINLCQNIRKLFMNRRNIRIRRHQLNFFFPFYQS